MHGVPADLGVDALVGHELIQVCLGEHQIQFHWDVGSISVEGEWELRDGGGMVLDRAIEHGARTHHRLHVLLGRKVVATALDVPSAFTLMFTGDFHLRVADDSRQYESFAVSLRDGRSWFV